MSFCNCSPIHDWSSNAFTSCFFSGSSSLRFWKSKSYQSISSLEVISFNPIVLNIRCLSPVLVSPRKAWLGCVTAHSISICISNELLNLELMSPFPQNQIQSSTSLFLRKWNPMIPNKILDAMLDKYYKLDMYIFLYLPNLIYHKIQNSFTFLLVHYYYSFPNYYTSTLDFCSGLPTYTPTF